MLNLTINADTVPAMQMLEAAPERLAQADDRAMFSSLTMLQRGVVGVINNPSRFPVSEGPAVAWGHLRDSIVIDWKQGSPVGIVAVGPEAQSYAPYVEYGTGPHPIGRAGIEALTQWALVKHLAGDEKTARSFAFAIAQVRKTKPMYGVHMFQTSFEMNEA